MTIAVHINHKDDIHDHVLNSFLTAATNHPEDHFIFISDKSAERKFPLPANCTPVNTGPEIKNSLLRYYWYNYKIPSILNRYQAEVFFTPREVCSLNTRVPQIMLLSEILARPHGRGEQLRKKYSEIAFKIGTFERSVFAKASRIFPQHKIFYAGHGPADEVENKVPPIDLPYFAAMITPHNKNEIILLLKAFSLFKKWQRSSYKMILIGGTKDISESIPNFSSYKYKDDVLLVPNDSSEKIVSALANAYTVIQLFHEKTGIKWELEAMRNNVPVISTCMESERKHYLDAAALYATNTYEGIAEQMMRMYKDESIHHDYSQRSREFAKPFQWNPTAETLYRHAEEAIR